MTEYSIRVEKSNEADVRKAIASYAEKIKVLGDNIKGRDSGYIKIETDQTTADALAAQTGLKVHEVAYASIDMGMQDSFMRAMAEHFAKEEKEDETSTPPDTAPKDPNGNPSP